MRYAGAHCSLPSTTVPPLWAAMPPGPTGSHSITRFTMRRLRLMVLGTVRSAVRCLMYLTGCALTDLVDFMCIPSAEGVSATCTAPPASRAPPAAVADNFAKAIFTDMSKLSCYFFEGLFRQRRFRQPRLPCHCNRRQHPIARNRVNHEKRTSREIIALDISVFGQLVPQWNRSGSESCQHLRSALTFFVEQAVLAIRGIRRRCGRRRGHFEMQPRPVVKAAATRGTGDQAKLDQVRLDHFFHRIARFA